MTQVKTYGVKAYGAQSAETPVAPFSIERREPGPDDVELEILYCGVCHSDIHTARNEWRDTRYPVVPGHEIVGRVTRFGSNVKDFKIGEIAAIGCLVDSCMKCEECESGHEQHCEVAMVPTYNGIERETGRPSFGGYSEKIVANQHFVLHVSDKLDPAAAAPLLCAGITTWAPLKHWKVGKGSRVGVVGLGGLGHMAVKLAHAMGAHVVLFTTSANKVEDAKKLGAAEVVLSNNKEDMRRLKDSLDVIVNTVSASHRLDPYLRTLKRDGTMVLVGGPSQPHPMPSVVHLMKWRNLSGSQIGGIGETQEMLDFCAEHGIVSDIELISMQDIEKAYERVLKSDVKYRFVIDMATLKSN